MIPSSPVVKRKIIVSCTLTIVRINVEEKNTKKPRKIFKTAAIPIGSVLNGLKASPSAGKNTGADWKRTATAVNKPPIQINLPISIFLNLNTPIRCYLYLGLSGIQSNFIIVNHEIISKTVPWLRSVTFLEP